MIPSHTGNRDLDFNITWPEINLGQSVTLGCPCGGIDLQSSFLVATRTCGGNYLEGAAWDEPNDGPCNFTDTVRELCLLAEVCPCTLIINKHITSVTTICVFLEVF